MSNDSRGPYRDLYKYLQRGGAAAAKAPDIVLHPNYKNNDFSKNHLMLKLLKTWL